MKYFLMGICVLALLGCEPSEVKTDGIDISRYSVPEGVTPISFKGVYFEGNMYGEDYQNLPRKPAKLGKLWELTEAARLFFRNHPRYKKLMRIKEFEDTTQRDLDTSLRFGFFSLDANHYIQQFSTGDKMLWVSLSLSWVEMGSAGTTDRQTLGINHDNEVVLEVLNTQKVILTGKEGIEKGISRQEKGQLLKKLYRKLLNKAMLAVAKKAVIHYFEPEGDPLYFMIDKFKLSQSLTRRNQKLKTQNLLSSYLQDTKQSASVFEAKLKLSLRNYLNQFLNQYRKQDEKYADIVLLPSINETKKLKKLWQDYTERYTDKINPYALKSIEARFKSVAPSCLPMNEEQVAGYWVTALFAEFEQQEVRNDKEDIGYQVHSVAVGKIILPLTQTRKRAAPDPTKAERLQAVAGESYHAHLVSKSIQLVNKLDVYEKTFEESIQDMASKLALKIKATVDRHRNDDLDFADLCY